jgi:hypothetical protein
VARLGDADRDPRTRRLARPSTRPKVCRVAPSLPPSRRGHAGERALAFASAGHLAEYLDGSSMRPPPSASRTASVCSADSSSRSGVDTWQ